MARIAILGLYNSGSTAIAGMLDRLGVNMGAPYWMTSQDAHPQNYYEPYDLSWYLRLWWTEPQLVAQVDAARRVAAFARWIQWREALRPGSAGAKHPLLSLCGMDLLAAWGAETRFIWVWRPVEDSIRQLGARGWFRGHEARMQGQLWDALHRFEREHPAVARIEWPRVLNDPAWGAASLATAAGLSVTAAQLEHAAALIGPR